MESENSISEVSNNKLQIRNTQSFLAIDLRRFKKFHRIGATAKDGRQVASFYLLPIILYHMLYRRIAAAVVLILAIGVGYYLYQSETEEAGRKFSLGLDLAGGSHLVFQADVSGIDRRDIQGSMDALRDVIERRINIFGVSEPIVQVEESFGGAEKIYKLIVELPGVTDISEAVAAIGKTPLLEFRLASSATSTAVGTTTPEFIYNDTGITGRFLKKAKLEFDPQTGEPEVSLIFNDEGKRLFAQVTKENVGRLLAIFLDGAPISVPVIREEIPDGRAQITGRFSVREARELVRNLNFGVLPLKVSLAGTQTIGASLGETALRQSIHAGIWSFFIIVFFLILWYRLPGLIASAALVVYLVFMLLLFKWIPVTLTSAGLAGFILSIGMAVDANILIFERMKEELRKGLDTEAATREGFARAWPSIRDSNISSMITAVILWFFAASNLIKGFALVFFLGVLMSMLTAISISRTWFLSLGNPPQRGLTSVLWSSGVRRTK